MIGAIFIKLGRAPAIISIRISVQLPDISFEEKYFQS
jgi:hypothetical protein